MGLWERWAIDDVTPAHLNWVRSLPKMIDEGDMFFCHVSLEHPKNALKIIGRKLSSFIIVRFGLFLQVMRCSTASHLAN